MTLALIIILIFVGFAAAFSIQVRFFSAYVMMLGLREIDPDISRGKTLALHKIIEAGTETDADKPLLDRLKRDFGSAIWYLTYGRKLTQFASVLILILMSVLLFIKLQKT